MVLKISFRLWFQRSSTRKSRILKVRGCSESRISLSHTPTDKLYLPLLLLFFPPPPSPFRCCLFNCSDFPLRLSEDRPQWASGGTPELTTPFSISFQASAAYLFNWQTSCQVEKFAEDFKCKPSLLGVPGVAVGKIKNNNNKYTVSARSPF